MADGIDRSAVAARDGLTAFALAEHEAESLLDLAETAIRRRLEDREIPCVDIANTPPTLQQRHGTFVTLHVSGELNGCIGSMQGTESLLVDVPDLAVKAAFGDPRLPALRTDDLAALSIEISLLSALNPVPATSHAELLRHLRPDEHGLVLESGRRRAVLLPDVWRQLPHPDQFVELLLRKAGLPRDPWPADLAAAVFTTAAVHRHLGEAL